MLGSLKERLTAFAARLGTQPNRIHKTILSVALVITLVAFVNNIALGSLATLFRGLLPFPTAEESQALVIPSITAEGTPRNYLTEIQNCISDRNGGSGDKLVAQFEESFSGVLPGAGKLMAENSGMVSDRKEKLIYEVLSNYARQKYCILPAEFKVIYHSGFTQLSAGLDVYNQTLNSEELEAPGVGGTKTGSTDAMERLVTAQNDLFEVKGYLKSVIENAIAAAISLDELTEKRVNNLAIRTANQLAAANNEIAKIGNDIGNENVKVNSANGQLLQNINIIEGSVMTFPVLGGGAGMPTMRPNGVAYAGNTFPHNNPDLDEFKPAFSSASQTLAGQVRFGLLNLVDEATRNQFLSSRFGTEFSLYVGATINADPLRPGVELSTTALSLNLDSQLCKSIDVPDTICYDTKAPAITAAAITKGSTIAEKVSTKDAAGVKFGAELLGDALKADPSFLAGAGEIGALLQSAKLAPTEAAKQAIMQQVEEKKNSLMGNVTLPGGAIIGDVSKMVSPEALANMANGGNLDLTSGVTSAVSSAASAATGLAGKVGDAVSAIPSVNPSSLLPKAPNLGALTGGLKGAIPSIPQLPKIPDLSAIGTVASSFASTLSFGVPIPKISFP